MNADICNDEGCQLCIVEEKGWQVVLGHSPACGAFLSERLDLQDSALALVLPSFQSGRYLNGTRNSTQSWSVCTKVHNAVWGRLNSVYKSRFSLLVPLNFRAHL